MGLSPSTSTAKLLKMGVHNTWEELVEAHNVNQLERLKLTKTGRALLQDLGYQVEDERHVPQRIPHEVRDKLRISTIPRNMHPEYDKERRQARIQALKQIFERTNSKEENVRYTVAAVYRTNNRFAISVVDEKGEELTATSIRAKDASTAEELGIALAIATCKKTLVTVVTDSQESCRRYVKGRIGKAALQVLRNTEIEIANILWTPGHESLAGNQAAHAATREIMHAEPSPTRREHRPTTATMMMNGYPRSILGYLGALQEE